MVLLVRTKRCGGQHAKEEDFNARGLAQAPSSLRFHLTHAEAERDCPALRNTDLFDLCGRFPAALLSWRRRRYVGSRRRGDGEDVRLRVEAPSGGEAQQLLHRKAVAVGQRQVYRPQLLLQLQWRGSILQGQVRSLGVTWGGA